AGASGEPPAILARPHRRGLLREQQRIPRGPRRGAANWRDVMAPRFTLFGKRMGAEGPTTAVEDPLYPSTKIAPEPPRAAASPRAPADDEPLDNDSASTARGPAEELDAKAAVRVLDELLARMPEAQREVFILHEVEQMTGREIAEAVGANENTVHTRLRAAR